MLFACGRRGAGVVCRPARGGGPASIKSDDLKEWLSYIASDELQGRARLQRRPRSGGGLYQRPPARLGGEAGWRHSSVSPDRARPRREIDQPVDGDGRRSGGDSRTFADGEGLIFPRNAGGKQRLTIDRVEFAGYGLDAPPRATPISPTRT